MRFASYANAKPEAPRVHLTHNSSTGFDNDGVLRHQVVLGNDFYLYASPAELSELGHRLIELAAQAEEREHGVDPKWGDLSASREAARDASREAVA